MTTATFEPTWQILEEAPTVVPAVAEGTRRRRRAVGPVLVMATGVVVFALAATLATRLRADEANLNPVERGALLPAPPTDPGAISLSERDVSVVTQVYEPGHDSGWHSHSGIHAVAVLSGELTVYDGHCRPTTYGPGRPYVGGRELHLVRNESVVPVEMSVTYLSPSAPTSSTERLAAPAGCVTPR